MEGNTVALLERLARLECRTCDGDELLMRSGEGDKPCLDCRDSEGQPTGLACPELTDECERHSQFHPGHCPDCIWGQGRIFKSGPARLVAVLDSAKRHGVHHIVFDYENDGVDCYMCPTGVPADYSEEGARWGGGSDELTAASKALAAALGVDA